MKLPARYYKYAGIEKRTVKKKGKVDEKARISDSGHRRKSRGVAGGP